MSDPHDEATHDPGSDPGARCGGRKERVLHTRISEELAEDIRRAARELRVPASNLVRNVLEEAFSALETVSERVGGWLEEAAQDLERIRTRSRAGASRDETDAAAAEASPGPEAGADDGVLGWQAITLNAPHACLDCGRKLVRGDRAHLGLTRSGAGASVLCRACFESRFA
jgi:hypothetical protein